MPTVFVRHADCPACGHRHRLCLMPLDPINPEYGYVCPTTGRPAAVAPWGEWTALSFPPRGVVMLTPLGAVSICTPLPMLHAGVAPDIQRRPPSGV